MTYEEPVTAREYLHEMIDIAETGAARLAMFVAAEGVDDPGALEEFVAAAGALKRLALMLANLRDRAGQ